MVQTVPVRVFVLSTGRTGTTFLASALKQLGADAHHEPGPRWLRNLSNARAAGAISHETGSRLLGHARGENLSDERVYVEASCLIYGLAEELLESFSDAMLVHLVRDPRGYIKSAMDWGVHRPGGRILNAIPYRRLAPPQYDPTSLALRAQWFATSRFERIAWGWSAMNAATRRGCASSDRCMTVRFEELVDDQHTGLQRIARAAGLNVSTNDIERLRLKPVNPAPRRRFPQWTDWSDTQLRILLERCGGEASKYGYTLKDDVAALLSSQAAV